MSKFTCSHGWPLINAGLVAWSSSEAVNQMTSTVFHEVSLSNLGFCQHAERENIHIIQKQNLSFQGQVFDVTQNHFPLILLVKLSHKFSQSEEEME